MVLKKIIFQYYAFALYVGQFSSASIDVLSALLLN